MSRSGPGEHEASLLPTASLRRRLAGGAVWAFAGRVGLLVTGIVVAGLVTRFLEPDAAGTYFLAMSIASGAALLAELGLHRVVVRFVAESLGSGEGGRARATIRHVFRLGSAGALVTAALFASPPGRRLLDFVFSATDLASVAWLIGALVLVRSLGMLRGETFRGFHDIKFASLFTGLDANIVTLAGLAVFALLTTDPTLGQVLGLTAAAWVPGLAVGALMLRRRMARLTGPGTESARTVMRVGWPLMVLSVGSLLINQADLWVVGARLSAEDAALYGAALRLIALVAVPLLILNAVLPPLVAELYSQGRKHELERILRVAATVAGLPAAGVLILFAAFGPWVMGGVFGEYYAAGGTLLLILSVGQLVNVWVGSSAFVLTMTGHERISMWITLLGGGLVVALSFALAAPFGSPGVAVGATLGLAAKNLLMLAATKWCTGVSTQFSPLYTGREVLAWLARR